MKLDQYGQSHLQKALSGMSGGFTLFEDRLYVRKDSMTYGFILAEVHDSTHEFCCNCGQKIPGAVGYWAKVVTEWPFGPPTIQKKPMCYDCAVPQ